MKKPHAIRLGFRGDDSADNTHFTSILPSNHVFQVVYFIQGSRLEPCRHVNSSPQGLSASIWSHQHYSVSNKRSRNSSLWNFLQHLSTSSPSVQTSPSKPYSRTRYSSPLISKAKRNCLATKVSFLIRLITNNYAIAECTDFSLLLFHSS